MNIDNFFKEFRKNFSFAMGKRILLYGIGTLAQSMIEGLQEFHFVGLMDKNPANVGKVIHGLPVIELKAASQKGDLIVIAADEAYWSIIFARIEQIEEEIPVYFLNGKKAVLDKGKTEETYWNVSENDLKKEIQKHVVISFDLFDTLLLRDMLYPDDIFELLGLQLKGKISFDFALKRKEAEASANNKYGCPKLHDIYQELAEITGADTEELKRIKDKEAALELSLVRPRSALVDIFHWAVACNKKVYLISDMYLSQGLIERMLEKCGIDGYTDLWISCEIGCSKHQGDIWEKLKTLENDRILHIGDNKEYDVQRPKDYGIDTFEIWSPYQMLSHSGIRDILNKTQTLNQRILIGLTSNELFQDPFCLYGRNGIPFFDTQYKYGYCGYGAILYNYILWILKSHINFGNKLFFFARDGYLLLQIYEMIKKYHNNNDLPEGIYLKISRRVVTVASIRTKDDIYGLLDLKYQGTFQECLRDRFGIESNGAQNNTIVSLPGEKEKLKAWVEPYCKQILENATEEREQYLQYFFSNYDDSYDLHVVDPSFLGTTQHFFEKTIQKNVIGYYMLAQRGKENPYGIGDRIRALYASKQDESCQDSLLRKKIYFFEGVLVAKEGMYVKCGKDGKFFTEKPGSNQRHWHLKEELHSGILAMAQRIEEIYQGIPLKDREVEEEFINELADLVLSEKCQLSEEITDSFWHECIYMQEKQRKIFG